MTEANPADAVEQSQPAGPADQPPDPLEELARRGIPAEAPEADVLEQTEEEPEPADDRDPDGDEGRGPLEPPAVPEP